MKNILTAIDVLHPDKKTLEFACWLANKTHSQLTGVFLENLIYADTPVMKTLYGSPYVETILTNDVPENVDKRKACTSAISHFYEECRDKNVKHNIHIERGIPAEELIEETRFADALVIDAETSFSKKTESVPSKFVTNVLGESECPVIISPERFEGIDEIVFAYDGSKSSFFAIKLFTYLFPQFTDRMIRVVQVNKDSDSNISERRRLNEWLQSHYSNIDIVLLYGEPGEELFNYLFDKEDVFVVMGAYGRSWLSNLFVRSKAHAIVKSINLPVFIAHY